MTNLNGTWQVEESVEANKMPSKYPYSVQVPGMVNQSTPSFPNVDEFYSKEYFSNSFVKQGLKKIPVLLDSMKMGYSFQKRNYFWYRRTIQINEKKEVYILKIKKAQFGTAVWVNGVKAGVSFDCFASQLYDVTKLIAPGKKNTVIIRIGAHPAVLPETVVVGHDYEKRNWTPGIYDDVSIIAANYPFIETVQVAPNIHKKEILVQTAIITKPGQTSTTINYVIKEWKSGKENNKHSYTASIAGTNKLIVTQNIAVPDPKLWSPASPFLYTVNISTGADDITTRFGMGEFRFETATKKAYLNDSIIYLRGSNITLHRFFDDSLCKNHPWDEKWVRKLLHDLPKKYNWNSFRFCTGPVPDKWFDIADEEGLLIQNEYFIWVWSYKPTWDSILLAKNVKQWMTDSWNHPSMAWWDICNETHSDLLSGIVKDVRSTDLSNRAWDNGFNLPQGDNDPVEDHHYKWYAAFPGVADCDIWSVQKFEKGTGEKASAYTPHPTAHAAILNEYGFLWLKRNGQRTLLTEGIYDSIAKGYTNEQRQQLYAYLLAAETEYFRAHRNYAGVMQFDYLTADFDGASTDDIFKNPETLEPVKVYDDYFSEIFKPLGLYVNYFPKEVLPSAAADIAVMLINDEYQTIKGNVVMELYNDKEEKISSAAHIFSVTALGQQTVKIEFEFPAVKGNYWLRTFAVQENGHRTLCRRKIIIN
ncbi:MAG: hypothetical protein H7320_09625 [Ferruginibacter sp.]|nr:hypothetical protein [Ferruginibacter sp.]